MLCALFVVGCSITQFYRFATVILSDPIEPPR